MEVIDTRERVAGKAHIWRYRGVWQMEIDGLTYAARCQACDVRELSATAAREPSTWAPRVRRAAQSWWGTLSTTAPPPRNRGFILALWERIQRVIE